MLKTCMTWMNMKEVTVRNGKKNKMQTFTAKKVTTTHDFFSFFFSCQLWFYMLQCLTTILIENLKMASQNENKQALQRRWTDMYHRGDRDNRCYKDKGTKRK